MTELMTIPTLSGESSLNSDIYYFRETSHSETYLADLSVIKSVQSEYTVENKM